MRSKSTGNIEDPDADSDTELAEYQKSEGLWSEEADRGQSQIMRARSQTKLKSRQHAGSGKQYGGKDKTQNTGNTVENIMKDQRRQVQIGKKQHSDKNRQ